MECGTIWSMECGTNWSMECGTNWSMECGTNWVWNQLMPRVWNQLIHRMRNQLIHGMWNQLVHGVWNQLIHGERNQLHGIYSWEAIWLQLLAIPFHHSPYLSISFSPSTCWEEAKGKRKGSTCVDFGHSLFFEFVFSPLLVASLHFELLYFASLLYASLHFCITTFYIIAFYCIYFQNINSFYYPASILSLFVYRIRECFSSIFFKFFCILLISIRDFTT